MTSTLYQLRASIPPNAIQHGVAVEFLPIWSVVEITTETELQNDGTMSTYTTEREVCVGKGADEAYRAMIESLRLLAMLPQAVKGTA